MEKYEFGNWHNNIKHGCFNTIIYKSYYEDGLYNKFLSLITICYYNMNIKKLINIKIDVENKNKVTLKYDDNTIQFNLDKEYSITTACHYINTLLVEYNNYYKSKLYPISISNKAKPLSLLDISNNQNKLCNCELCNFIIKNRKIFNKAIN